ncbi:MAG: PilN domain-containing protein [Phycisphaerales bacterium]
MVIGQTRLVVTLTPTRIEAAVVSGRKIRASKRVLIRAHDWEQAWGEGLSPYDTALANLLKALGVSSGARADVLYTSPTTVSEVRFIAGDRDAAPVAARLALLERISGGSHEHIAAATALDVEAVEEGASVVLTTCDADAHSQAIFAWLARAGCRLGVMIPEHAIRLRRAVQMIASCDEDDRVACQLDERTTILLCGGRGKLRAIRSIDFGYALLSEAYARGMRSESDDTPEQSSGQPDSLERLFKSGIPAKSQAAAEREALRRVMPLLQPVLQRYCIELKQTVRFGMPGLEAPPSHILFTGPGAAIPRLCASIAENTDAYADIDPAYESFDPKVVSPPGGSELELIENPGEELRLVPRIVAEQTAARRIASGVRTGALCAALALAGEGAMLYAQQRRLDAAIRDGEPVLQSVREHRAQSERAVEMDASLGRAVRITEAKISDQPDWFAVLAELAALVPEPVTIEDVRGFEERGQSVLTVAGSIEIDPNASAGSGLPGLMEAFRTSPLFADVQLGATNLYQTETGSAKRFVLRATPYAFDADALVDGATDITAEVEP